MSPGLDDLTRRVDELVTRVDVLADRLARATEAEAILRRAMGVPVPARRGGHLRVVPLTSPATPAP